MEGEALPIAFFNRHYDLARQPVGMRWDFINNMVERELRPLV